MLSSLCSPTLRTPAKRRNATRGIQTSTSPREAGDEGGDGADQAFWKFFVAYSACTLTRAIRAEHDKERGVLWPVREGRESWERRTCTPCKGCVLNGGGAAGLVPLQRQQRGPQGTHNDVPAPNTTTKPTPSPPAQLLLLQDAPPLFTPPEQAGTHKTTTVAPSGSFSLTHNAKACSQKPIPTHNPGRPCAVQHKGPRPTPVPGLTMPQQSTKHVVGAMHSSRHPCNCAT